MTEGAFLHYCMCHSKPLNTNNQYLFSRFRLAFSPTLYKFIVRACWAWVHSCFGVRVKISPYINYLLLCSASNRCSIRPFKSLSSSTLPMNFEKVKYKAHWTFVTRSWMVKNTKLEIQKWHKIKQDIHRSCRNLV